MSLRICPQAFLHLLMMKRIVLLQLITLTLSCNNQTSFKKAEDAQDAGREFIRASLDGNYEKATFYLLQDSTNQMLMGKWKKDYDQLDADSKNRYKEADILPIDVTTQSDSVTTYTFSNSYKKDTTRIRIVRINGEWLVDLKEILNRKK
jgi:hypothetical protein